MKLFHLADLHIGVNVNGYSMLPDQEYILARILDSVKEEGPDALLLAGDIYDKQTPSGEAVRLFDQFLTEAAKLGVPVILISGNHDSPERLSFASGIMDRQGVHIYGSFDGTLHTVSLKDAYGELRVHLMPYLRPSIVRRFFPEQQGGDWQQAVRTALEHHPPDETIRNVLLSHQFVTAAGIEPERSESEIGPVGGLDAVDISLFRAFDYVALGHLHGPQNIAGGQARYAGSPLKYSFSECSHKKSITVVELGNKGAVEVSTLPLNPLREMRKITGPLKTLLSEEVASQGNREDYLHVTLTDEEEILDAIGRVRSVYPNVMALTFDNRRSRASGGLENGVILEDKTPFELFSDFYLEQNGSRMDSGQESLVRPLLEGDGE